MKKTIYLSYDKAKKVGAIIEWEDYKSKYVMTKEKNIQYRVLVGTPLVVRVQGTYVLVDKIPDLFERVPQEVLDYIRGLKQVSLTSIITFKWRDR